jgi:hypothetical protein
LRCHRPRTSIRRKGSNGTLGAIQRWSKGVRTSSRGGAPRRHLGPENATLVSQGQPTGRCRRRPRRAMSSRGSLRPAQARRPQTGHDEAGDDAQMPGPGRTPAHRMNVLVAGPLLRLPGGLRLLRRGSRGLRRGSRGLGPFRRCLFVAGARFAGERRGLTRGLLLGH